MERWWCLDCQAVVELNVHGQCGCCGSEAVDTAYRKPLTKKDLAPYAVALDFKESAPNLHLEATPEANTTLPRVHTLGGLIKAISRIGQQFIPVRPELLYWN